MTVAAGSSDACVGRIGADSSPRSPSADLVGFQRDRVRGQGAGPVGCGEVRDDVFMFHVPGQEQDLDPAGRLTLR
jgi:hypothetical protein